MDFYYMSGSSTCRAVQMTAKAVGVELDLKTLNLMNKEQLAPEFVAINPQHTIPTLVDNGFAIWESRAILGYLADSYGSDSIYPKDAKKRAVVNQRLYFDMGVLYHRFAEYFYPQIREKTPADPEKLKKLEEALGFLNTFLDGQTYVAGENLTIADLALFATVSSFTLAGIDIKPYSNVEKWSALLEKTAPGREINQQGLDDAKKFFDDARK